MGVNRVYLMACLALLANPLLVHAKEAIQYEIDAKFVAYPTNDTVAAMGAIDTTLVSSNEFSPKNLGPNLGTPPATWSVLSAPRVTTVAGVQAQIRVVEEPPQYFEKQADGSFQLRQMSDKDSLGITLTVTTMPGTIDETVKLEAQVKYRSIMQREQLPGVSLDVGKPTIRILTHKFTMEVAVGDWILSNLSGFVYPGHENGDQEMLLLVRIRRVNERGQPIDAAGRVVGD